LDVQEAVMKSIKTFVVIGIFLMLSPGNLFASCPTISSHACCGSYTWKTYTFDLSCGGTSSSNVTTTTMWCGEPSHRVAYPTTSTETVTYYYVIPDTSSGWEIRLDYEFTNGGSTSNFNRADYTLTRNGSQVGSGNIYYTDVAASCAVGSLTGMSMNAGDLLQIVVTMRTASSGSYAETSNLTLFKVPA
jgi:hypothetical protein